MNLSGKKLLIGLFGIISLNIGAAAPRPIIVIKFPSGRTSLDSDLHFPAAAIQAEKDENLTEIRKLFGHASEQTSPRDLLAEISRKHGGTYAKSNAPLCVHAIAPGSSCFNCRVARHMEVCEAIKHVAGEKNSAEAKQTADGAGSVSE